jgi:type IV pilus assembly protein PilE
VACKQTGLTMIELVIVMALIAILSAIGYPIYAEQVAKTRRSDAQGALLAFANAMERHAAANPTTGYDGAGDGYDAGPPRVLGNRVGAPDADVFPREAPLNSTEKFYDLSIQAVTMDGNYGRAYVIQAVPKGRQVNDDCGTFTLSSQGVRALINRPAGFDPDAACWR